MIENLYIYSISSKKRIFSLIDKLSIREDPFITEYLQNEIYPNSQTLNEEEFLIKEFGEKKTIYIRNGRILFIILAESSEMDNFLINMLMNSIPFFTPEIINYLEDPVGKNRPYELQLARISLLKSLLKIVFIGSIGFSQVGRTTFFTCINGRLFTLDFDQSIFYKEIPSIKGLTPYLWNYMGPSLLTPLWPFLIQDTAIILLTVDSTQIGVNNSKRVFMKLISNVHPKAKIIVLATMQDLPERLPPSEIKEILGVEDCIGLKMRSIGRQRGQLPKLLMNESELEEINVNFNQILENNLSKLDF